MPPSRHEPRTTILTPGAAIAGLLGALTLALTATLASIGGPQDPAEALGRAVYVLLVAGAAPAAYLAGAIGLGTLFAPLTRSADDGAALRAALGVAAMLWISTVLGSLHLDTGWAGRILAGAPVAAGLVLLALTIRRAGGAVSSRVWRLGLSGALAAPAALLLAAALNPPGWLWDSEFGAYDALSYHLQLPQEWLAAGRIVPVEHNVYSFLPGFVESAFAHVAVLAGVDRPYAADAAPTGLLTGDGLTATSCQLLHAGLALLAAWLVARAAALAARRIGLDGAAPRLAGIGAGALFLATPWVIVTGSLAYNEMGVTAMLAGALIVALDEGPAPRARGLLAGVLVGAACGAKPTAFFLAGVPLALVLFGLARPRHWPVIAGVGCAAGLVVLAPWLIRNAIASGNPVFPYAASIFGDAHWTPEQIDRFATHHAFQGSWTERLRLLLVEDAADPSGARHRGLMHPQWAAFFPITLASIAAAGACRPRARTTWLLAAMTLAQLLLWMTTTHIQSRFLLPLAVTGSVLLGVAGAAIWSRGARPARVAAASLVALAALVQLGAAIHRFSVQRAGQPNRRLLLPPAALTGAGVDEEIVAANPTMTVNRAIPPSDGLYLLADATPFYITRPVLYNTTWDTWPLGEAARAHPADPGAWTRTLRERGIRYVLVNLIMLDVFTRSGSNDPAVTPETLRAWLEHPTTRPAHDWRRGSGKILVELTEGTR